MANRALAPRLSRSSRGISNPCMVQPPPSWANSNGNVLTPNDNHATANSLKTQHRPKNLHLKRISSRAYLGPQPCLKRRVEWQIATNEAFGIHIDGVPGAFSTFGKGSAWQRIHNFPIGVSHDNLAGGFQHLLKEGIEQPM